MIRIGTALALRSCILKAERNMVITVTGASGKTGSQVVSSLINQHQKIRAITRSEQNLLSLKKFGIDIMVGDQSDPKFLTEVLTGSDAAYILIPPKNNSKDILNYYHEMGEVALKALRDSSVKRVVFLSSLGAQHKHGVGPVCGLNDVEQILGSSKKYELLILRAGYFMENFIGNLPFMKDHQFVPGSIMPDVPVQMVSCVDIGAYAASQLTKSDFSGSAITELFGDVLDCQTASMQIGEATRIGELPYVMIPDEDMVRHYRDMGFSESVAFSYIEFAHGINTGLIRSSILDPSKPNMPTNFSAFAREILANYYV